jgi:hypothetical protein
MTALVLSLFVIPIALVTWLAMVFYADAHPAVGRQDKAKASDETSETLLAARAGTPDLGPSRNNAGVSWQHRHVSGRDDNDVEADGNTPAPQRKAA